MLTQPAAVAAPPTRDLPVIGVYEPRLRTTTFCLAVAHGARQDPRGGCGVAHLLEHLLFSLPSDGATSFAERVERGGGHANAQTGVETTLFYAQVAAEDAAGTADALLRAVLRPRLTDPAPFDRERAVVVSELRTAAADPADTVQDAAAAAVFPGHPLARPVGGDLDELATLTPEGVLREHREVFLRAPMSLVVVGPAPVPGLDALLRDALPTARTTAPGDVERPPLSAPDTTLPALPRGDDIAWVCLAGRTPAAGTPGTAAYELLATLLGSSPSSLLYRTLRGDESLSYSFAAWSRPYTEGGLWRLLAGVEGHAVERLVDLVRGLLTDIAEGRIRDEDLLAARRKTEMSLVLQAENPLDHALLIALRGRAGTQPWSIDANRAELAAVTAADVSAAAAALLAEHVVVVRPEAS
ncbi:M16 family metallopeptidase [Streptomyces sp. NPDC048182]|uniref:M16 family metallopeptidase n=1 Tax=Streptomyces sp. NPDC048182 TaxID=3365507 RepID=UPI00371D016C